MLLSTAKKKEKSYLNFKQEKGALGGSQPPLGEDFPQCPGGLGPSLNMYW